VGISAVAVATSLGMAAASGAAGGDHNPFAVPAVRAYLATRIDVSAAVYDVTSESTYLYRSGVEGDTASIIKVNILALLLYQSQQRGVGLSEETKETATSMIEYSDNDSATDLWDMVGGQGAVAAFDRKIGMTATTPNVDWGLTTTTPADQLTLLKLIALPNKVLDNASRAYARNLMEHVVSYERFGIGWGTPAGAAVAMKDGWYPESSGWQTNTIGFVKSGRRFYLVAVMAAHEPSQAYGEDTLTDTAQLIWRTLRP
jgi:beta-lactamase class A